MAALAIGIGFSVSIRGAHAIDVNLAWDPSASPGVKGYTVHYGTQPHSYTSTIDAGNATSATITGLSSSQAYFIAVTSYDTGGTQSVASNEVLYGTFVPVAAVAPGTMPGTGITTGTSPSTAAGGGGGGGGCATAPGSRPDPTLPALLGLCILALARRARFRGR